MKGDPQVLSYLNQYLTIELTGHKQYFLHAGMCGHWGFGKLAEKQAGYSAEEMRHANRILPRLLFLEGQPTLQDARPIQIKGTVEEQLTLDQELVTHAMHMLREAAAYCRSQKDQVSEQLFQEMLADEEEHVHWLESQLALLQKLGVQNYLQAQM